MKTLPEAYTPFGTFSTPNGKFEASIAIALPNKLKGKPEIKKFKPKVKRTYDVSTKSAKANGILVVIEIDNCMDNLQTMGESATDYHVLKKISKFDNSGEFDPSVEDCRVIVYHSNHFDLSNEKVLIQRAKEYTKNNVGDLNSDFDAFLKNVEDGWQPETSGESILVGTGN